jgi:Asp-tRNA(Asn)/Glu-tRNA(Gln) amidotransferase C subunit
MIEVTRNVIDICAENLMFRLNPGQADLIAQEFSTVLAQIAFLASIPNVDAAEPMTFPYHEHQKILRDDKPVKPLLPSETLANCHTRLGDQIKLPKVVGNQNDEVD